MKARFLKVSLAETEPVKFTMIAGASLLMCAVEARAEYPPYRYAPVGVNRVVLVPRDGGNACSDDCRGCCSGHSCLSGHGLFGHHHGHSGGSSYGGGMRMEYAPYRYLPAQRQLPVPPGIAGQVASGALAEQRFVDLQPRYTYPRSPYAPVNRSPVSAASEQQPVLNEAPVDSPSVEPTN